MSESLLVSKPRFRFNDATDLLLLQEVYGQNPFEDSSRWKIIQTNIIQVTGRSLTIRALRERVRDLLNKFVSRLKENEGKSGIEIEVSEMDDLLQLIKELLESISSKKPIITLSSDMKDSREEKSTYQKGYEARERASTSLQEPQDVLFEDDINLGTAEIDINHTFGNQTDTFLETVTLSNENDELQDKQENELRKTPMAKTLPQSKIATPMRKRCVNLKQNTIQYLIKKNDRNFELRNRELALKEKKQLLEEKSRN